MAIYANLRDYDFESEVDDIRGSDVYSVDEDYLGTIDDVIFDNRTGDLGYVVIDTGGWLETDKFMVPARMVMSDVEGPAGDFLLNLTKDQIRTFPPYNEKALRDDQRWLDYEDRYHTAFKVVADPVLHREGSTHTT